MVPLSYRGAVRALIFLARRIQPFLSLVERKVDFFVLNDLIVLHLLGILFFIFLFLSEKNPVYRDSNSRPNVSEGYEVTSGLPGRPALQLNITTVVVVVLVSLELHCTLLIKM